MGGFCSKIENATKPDARKHNVNLCTTYEKFDPSKIDEKSIIIPNSGNNVGGQGEPISSAFIVPRDLCIANLAGSTFDNKVSDYCHGIGDEVDGKNEWEAAFGKSAGIKGANYALRGIGSSDISKADNSKIKINCHFNGCDGKTSLDFSGGCCKGCCSTIGTRVACKRANFNADPVVCCFLDNACAQQDGTENDETCFQTKNKRRTCSPQYRDLKSSDCLEKIKPYCMGDKLFAGQSNWMELWLPNSQVDVNSGQDGTTTEEDADGSNQRYMKQPCLRALARAVYSDSGGVCTWEQFSKLDSFQGVVDPGGLAWAQDVLEAIFSKYIKEYGSPIGAIDQDGYIPSSDFLDFYWNLCKTFPAICQNSLNVFCRNIKVEDLLERPEAIKWCGCHMTDDQYQQYEEYSINRECTPYCNMKGNIPLVDDDLTSKVCTQTTCIIDDVSIKLAQVINPDGFNFNQLCNSCGGSEISKIFTGLNENKIDPQKIGGNTVAISGDTFSQFIPSNVTGIKFWYTDVPSNASVDSDGHMMVQLAACRNDGTDVDAFPFDLITGRDNPVVTLNYSSKNYTNFKGLGAGTLYYITGIKNIIYTGNFKNDQDNVVIYQYLTKTGYSNIKNNTYSDNQTNLNKFGSGSNNQYYSVDYNFNVFSLPVIDNSNVKNNFIKSNSIDKNIWNCWFHYTLGFKLKITIEDIQEITNTIREDNIQINANTCSCVIRGSTIDLEDARIRSLNINQNCGGSQCFNSKGNTIPCGANTIEGNEIINVRNSIKQFEKELITDKRKLITAVLIIVLAIVFLIWLSVQHRRKK